MPTEHFSRGDRVTFGATKTVWKLISVSTGPGGHQRATMRSLADNPAWRYDKPLKGAKRVGG